MPITEEEKKAQEEMNSLLDVSPDTVAGEDGNEDEETTEEDTFEDEESTDSDDSEDAETEDDDEEDAEGEEDSDSDSSKEDSEEQESEDKEDTAGEVLKSQNERLLSLIETMAGEKKATPKKEAVDLYETPQFKALAEVLELDENEAKVLKAFMQTMQTDTQQRSVEQALKDTPQVVGQYVNRKQTLDKLKEDFWVANPQLKAVGKYVGQIANSISAKNPDASMGDVLDKAAEVTYKALGIKKELAKKKEKPGKRKKPAFAKGSKGGRKKPLKKSKLESDMQAMIDLD